MLHVCVLGGVKISISLTSEEGLHPHQAASIPSSKGVRSQFIADI